MMDAKTAVIQLRKQDTLEDRKDDKQVYWCLTNKMANDIADIIDKQEKYAELGRLALTTRAAVCSNNDFIIRGIERCKAHCVNCEYCQKRAELLTEDSHR